MQKIHLMIYYIAPFFNQNGQKKLCVYVCNDDDCFYYYYSWRNNGVIAFGTLTSFLT